MFCAGFGARCARVDKVAVFSIHKRSVLSTYCKIRYESKFISGSRGSPCDSAAFFFSKSACIDAIDEKVEIRLTFNFIYAYSHFELYIHDHIASVLL